MNAAQPLTRLEQEAIKLRKIRLNQPPVTYEQAMQQFERHRKAMQESGHRNSPPALSKIPKTKI